MARRGPARVAAVRRAGRLGAYRTSRKGRSHELHRSSKPAPQIFDLQAGEDVSLPWVVEVTAATPSFIQVFGAPYGAKLKTESAAWPKAAWQWRNPQPSPTKLESSMPEQKTVYSSLFQCLYDQQQPIVPHYYPYSVFRAIDSRDVTQVPTLEPRVHDFAVLWDEDHDTRVISVLEEMLMAGVLPGVQFISEHKGELTIILAAPTYFAIDLDAFKTKVHALTATTGDWWVLRIGIFDRSPHSLRTRHQCDFEEIVGLSDEATHAYLYSINDMWNLGTKEWRGVNYRAPATTQPGQFFLPERYVVTPQRR